MPKFRMTAKVTLDCERVIEADNEHDAYDEADRMGEDEWISWVTGPGSVDDVDCMGEVHHVCEVKEKKK